MTLLTLRIDLTATGSRWFGSCCCGYHSAPRKTIEGITNLMDVHLSSTPHRKRMAGMKGEWMDRAAKRAR